MPQFSLKNYQEDRSERGVYDRRNKLNDLTGKEWLFSTKTIIPKRYPRELFSSLPLQEGQPIPVELSREIIETFTKPLESVLDPFPGLGSTFLGVHSINNASDVASRSVIGIEDDSNFQNQFKQTLDHLNIQLPSNMTYSTSDFLEQIKNESVDFILTDLPIRGEIRDNLDINSHLMNRSIVNSWINTISLQLTKCIPKLKTNKYMVLILPFTKNLTPVRKNTGVELNYTLTNLLVNKIQEHSLVLKAERFWFEPQENSLEPILVYPERRMLVFRKEIDSFPPNYLNSTFFQHKFPKGSTFILHKSYPPSFEHKLRSQHGGMKPPELMHYLIERYSSDSSDLILDPFVGVGGTLLAATIAQRTAIGVDINDQWMKVYSEVCERMKLPTQKFIVGNSTQVIDQQISDDSVGMIMTDVPYWAMDKLTKTRGRFSKAGEISRDKLHSSLKEFNQSEILSLSDWQSLMKDVFTLCYDKLQSGKSLIVFIGNMYRTLSEKHQGQSRKIGRFLMLSAVLADILLSIGFDFEEEIVWYAPDKALHIFGYPYSYIPSVVHQDILVFRKTI